MSFSELQESVLGEVVGPDDSVYEDARSVYNAMHDRRPAAIVRAADTADVAAAIRHALDHDLELAVRGGGHSVPGFGTCDDGLVIDLGPIRNTHVDRSSKTAWVGGGATFGDFDHATHAYGLATTGGVISTTGVGGLTLGGGIGHLTRGCGLSLDNLLAAEVVTATGDIVIASDYENTDLFWALRGGGGNFGVVTCLEFQLHECSTVVGGPIFYDPTDARAVMEFYREFIVEAPSSSGASSGGTMRPRCRSSPRTASAMCSAPWSPAGTDRIEEADAVLKPLTTSPRSSRRTSGRRRTRRSTLRSTRWCRPDSSTTGRPTSSPN